MIRALGLAGLLFASSLAPAQALSLRGMETPQEFRIGPILQSGLALGAPALGDRQFYQLELRGESPDFGTSKIFLRIITLYELLGLATDLNQENSATRQVRLHQQFVSLGLQSPIWYSATRGHNFEWGWTSGFTLARVQFKDINKPSGSESGVGAIINDYPELQPSALGAQAKVNPGQPDTQFIGGELGVYGRYDGLYPLVPHASVRMSLGSLWDRAAFVDGVEQKQTNTIGSTTPTTPATPTRQRFYQSAFRVAFVPTVGLDLYLWSRGLIGLEYSLWNWDVGQTSDYTHLISIKAGFLF